MKKKEWNEGLNHMDPDLVEKYVEQKEALRQKNRAADAWIRLGAIAACFALVLSAILFVPMLRVDTPTGLPLESVPLSSSAPQYYGSDIRTSGSYNTDINPEGISVTARLRDVLPDTYTFYDDWKQTEFRLLKMETVTLLKGEEMTDCFYYIVPVSYMTDFTVFDTFVIVDMAQYGYEHSVLYNKTRDCAEQLDTVLLGYLNTSFANMGESFMAFDSDGNFDERLWSANERWLTATRWASEKLLNGYSLAQAEQEHRIPDGYRYIHLLDGVTGEAAAALEYIKKPENGLYIPGGSGTILSHSPEVQFRFQRYINGFSTNEGGRIYSDRAVSSKAHFTKEDEKSLPDLPSAYATIKAAFERGEILPPHILGHSEMENTASGIYGWYAKTATDVIGVIRVSWRYRDTKALYLDYYDDAYYIIEYGSRECYEIDRDTLLEKLGDYEATYVYTGEYDEHGRVIDRYAAMP